MADFDRTLPAALAEVNARTYDYDEGNGVDFKPCDQFQSADDVMPRAQWHRFQVLTKRADRVAALDGDLEWPDNVWIGVSFESARYVGRIGDCRTREHA